MYILGFLRLISNVNLTEYIADEKIWMPSYYIQIWPPPHRRLAPCVTLNLPQEKILKPNQAEVNSQNIQYQFS